MVPIEAIRLVFSSIASTAVVAGPLLESETTKGAMLRSIFKMKSDTGLSRIACFSRGEKTLRRKKPGPIFRPGASVGFQIENWSSCIISIV